MSIYKFSRTNIKFGDEPSINKEAALATTIEFGNKNDKIKQAL